MTRMNGFQWLMAGWAASLAVAWVLIITADMSALWAGPLCLVGLIAGGVAGKIYRRVRR